MIKFIHIKFLFGLLCSTVFLISNGESKAQTRSYLTGQKTGNYMDGSILLLGPGSAGLSAPMSSHSYFGFRYFYGNQTLLTGTTSTPVKIRAAKDVALLGKVGTGANAYLQFRNTNNTLIAGGKTTYFSIDKPTLSGVSVAVGGLLGLVELQSLTAMGYAGAGNYELNSGVSYNGDENTGTPVATSTSKILLDKDAKWHIAVTPGADYNAVRLNVALPEDLVIADAIRGLEVNVYNAFNQTDGGTCNLSPQFTSPGEVLGGITLNTGVIGGLQLSQLVSNPERAINNNANDYSSFSSGLASVGVANSVAQSFYFDHKATVNDGIRLQLGIQNSLIDLDLLKLTTIKFRAYNGTSALPVFENSLDSAVSLLQLNLLNLVTINGSNHKKLDLLFKPSVAFDRFEVVFEQGVAAVGVLGDALRIYEVSLAPSLPDVTLLPTGTLATSVCEGSIANFSVSATATGGGTITGYQWQYLDASQNWVDAPLGNTNTLNITTTNAMNNRWYRVKISGGLSSCPQVIYTNESQLKVKPKSQASDINVADVVICQGHSATLTASSTTVGNPSFKWYTNSALTGSPVSLTHQYSTSPNTTTSYWVTVEGTGQCQNAPQTAKQVTVTVNPLIGPPLLTITTN